MTVADLIEILNDTNPKAPVFLDYCGFIFEADSVEVQNGKVYIQGSGPSKIVPAGGEKRFW